MTLKFHNTLTGHVDEFVSIALDKVLMYNCGPTVYGYPHIGNWASYIYWDTLVRILMVNNYDVTRVINITDVGHLTSDADEGQDKLEKSAEREGKTAWEIAKFYTDDFIKGIDKLGLITPQFLAKATDYIPDQINLIRELKTKGFTYQIDDGIYFDTSKFPTYANFAHLNLTAQQAGARIEFNPQKRNSSDFALWKFTPTGAKRDMEWETPQDILDDGLSIIGYSKSQAHNSAEITIQNPKSKIQNIPVMGFPGWHLECSAIAMSILDKTIDIHTGGIDHIPVHHTNEIAQSQAATGVQFCNYWLHNDFLKINGTKISKSLGNAYTLNDIEKNGFSPLDFRLFVLQGNYKNEGNFTFESLQAARNRLHNWRNIAALRHQTHDTIQADSEKNHDNKTVLIYATPQAIIEAIDNDLGTPEALKIIDDAFSHILNTKLKNINRQSLIHLLETIDSTLGLQLISSTPDISDEIKQIIIKRNSARDQKDWKLADELRDKLTSLGIILRDTETECIWEYETKDPAK